MDWSKTRGVVFIDPFGADVNWSTIKRIAEFNALDMWLLYPTSAITRICPKGKLPDDAVSGWSDKLTSIFGGDAWRELYKEDPQQTLTGKPLHLRDDAKEISKLYQKKLKHLFGDKFLDKTYEFKTRANTVLFEFMFCVGNTGGINLAKRLAKYILEKPGR
jgi:three-Cys-motif partner protein